MLAAAEETGGYALSEEGIQQLESEMKECAKRLEFEKAAELRDRIRALREQMLKTGVKL